MSSHNLTLLQENRSKVKDCKKKILSWKSQELSTIGEIKNGKDIIRVVVTQMKIVTSRWKSGKFENGRRKK